MTASDGSPSPLRVMVISSELPPGPGGIGAHAFELATALSRSGSPVLVVGCQHYTDAATVRAFNAAADLDVVTLPDRADVARTALARARVLRRELRRFRPDVVLASGSRLLWLAAALCPEAGVAWVGVIHGSEVGETGRSAHLTRLALGRADAVVAVSRFTRTLAVDRGVRPRHPIEVIPNGADGDRFGVDADAGAEFRSRFGLEEAPVVVTVGNVTERKGQHVVVRSLPALVARVPEVRYVVVGRPTEETALHALAAELGVSDHLVLTGQLDAAAINAAYNAADVFAMTSVNTDHGDVEGYGIAIAEAALGATPAVVSRGTGAEEAVIDGVTGLVVDPARPDDVADALARLLTDPAERARLGTAARDHVRADGTWDQVVTRYDEVFRRVVHRARPSGRIVVVSHTEHHRSGAGAGAGVVGFGPTTRELDQLAGLFDELVHIAPLHDGPPPGNALPARAGNVRYVPVPPAGGGSWRDRVLALRAVPTWAWTIDREVRRAEVVHVRLPAGIAMVALAVLTLRRSPATRWFKYAGNWQPPQGESITYRVQRWWLRRHLARGEVTVNGQWPDQPAWVHAFNNPTLTRTEIERGREAARTKAGAPPLRLAFVGRVEREKGAGVAVDALGVLARSGLDVHLDVVGDGPLRAPLTNQVRAEGIADRVTFHGWLTRAEVEEVLAQAHALVLPSGASEGFPKVIAEAMAFGAVPVTSRVSSVGQVLDECGLDTAVDPVGADEVTAVLHRLTDDPAELARQRDLGLASVERFSYEHYLRAVADLLDRTPGSPSKP